MKTSLVLFLVLLVTIPSFANKLKGSSKAKLHQIDVNDLSGILDEEDFEAFKGLISEFLHYANSLDSGEREGAVSKQILDIKEAISSFSNKQYSTLGKFVWRLTNETINKRAEETEDVLKRFHFEQSLLQRIYNYLDFGGSQGNFDDKIKIPFCQKVLGAGAPSWLQIKSKMNPEDVYQIVKGGNSEELADAFSSFLDDLIEFGQNSSEEDAKTQFDQWLQKLKDSLVNYSQDYYHALGSMIQDIVNMSFEGAKEELHTIDHHFEAILGFLNIAAETLKPPGSEFTLPTDPKTEKALKSLDCKLSQALNDLNIIPGPIENAISNPTSETLSAPFTAPIAQVNSGPVSNSVLGSNPDSGSFAGPISYVKYGSSSSSFSKANLEPISDEISGPGFIKSLGPNSNLHSAPVSDSNFLKRERVDSDLSEPISDEISTSGFGNGSGHVSDEASGLGFGSSSGPAGSVSGSSSNQILPPIIDDETLEGAFELPPESPHQGDPEFNSGVFIAPRFGSADRFGNEDSTFSSRVSVDEISGPGFVTGFGPNSIPHSGPISYSSFLKRERVDSDLSAPISDEISTSGFGNGSGHVSDEASGLGFGSSSGPAGSVSGSSSNQIPPPIIDDESLEGAVELPPESPHQGDPEFNSGVFIAPRFGSADSFGNEDSAFSSRVSVDEISGPGFVTGFGPNSIPHSGPISYSSFLKRERVDSDLSAPISDEISTSGFGNGSGHVSDEASGLGFGSSSGPAGSVSGSSSNQIPPPIIDDESLEGAVELPPETPHQGDPEFNSGVFIAPRFGSADRFGNEDSTFSSRVSVDEISGPGFVTGFGPNSIPHSGPISYSSFLKRERVDSDLSAPISDEISTSGFGNGSGHVSDEASGLGFGSSSGPAGSVSGSSSNQIPPPIIDDESLEGAVELPPETPHQGDPEFNSGVFIAPRFGSADRFGNEDSTFSSQVLADEISGPGFVTGFGPNSIPHSGPISYSSFLKREGVESDLSAPISDEISTSGFGNGSGHVSDEASGLGFGSSSGPAGSVSGSSSNQIPPPIIDDESLEGAVELPPETPHQGDPEFNSGVFIAPRFGADSIDSFGKEDSAFSSRVSVSGPVTYASSKLSSVAEPASNLISDEISGPGFLMPKNTSQKNFIKSKLNSHKKYHKMNILVKKK